MQYVWSQPFIIYVPVIVNDFWQHHVNSTMLKVPSRKHEQHEPVLDKDTDRDKIIIDDKEKMLLTL